MPTRVHTSVIVIVLLSFCSTSGYSLEASHCDADCLKEFRTVHTLVEKCKKPEWDYQGCTSSDIKKLTSYILHFCGEMPVNHHMNEGYVIHYISNSMLNSAFIKVWSWLNQGDPSWAKCVICLLGHPFQPGFETYSFCEN